MNFQKEINNYHEILVQVEETGIDFDFEKERLAFKDAEIYNENIANKNLDCIAFVRCILSNMEITNSFLPYGLLFENKFDHVHFSGCDLREVQLYDGHISNCTFKNCNLKSTKIANIELTNCTFIDCNMDWNTLRDLKFNNCILQNISLVGTTLNNVEFNNSELLDCVSNEKYKISLVSTEKGRLAECYDLKELYST